MCETVAKSSLEQQRVRREALLLLYYINVLVHLAIAFTYIVTSHGVLGARQALERRRLLCEQPLSGRVSCLPLFRARVKENSSLQNDANIVTYVEGWALRCARIDRKLGSFRKANEVSKFFGIAGQLLKVYDTLFSVGWWPDRPHRPHRPLSEPASHTRAGVKRPCPTIHNFVQVTLQPQDALWVCANMSNL